MRSLLAGTRTLDASGDAVQRANGAIFLPGPETTGPLSRRAELDALVREVTAAEHELDQLIRTAERAAHEHEQAERALETAAEAAEAARARLRETETSADEADRNSHRIEREKIEADATLARLTQRMAQRNARLKQIEHELSSGDKERNRLVTDLDTQRATLQEIEETQEAARERRVHWQVEEVQVSAREEAAQERESRAAETMADAKKAMMAFDGEIASIDEDNRDVSAKQARWNEALSEKRVEVEQMQRAAGTAETAVQEADSAVQHADEELASARETLERFNEEAHRIELSVTEGAGHRQALIERIEAEWHKPLADLLEGTEEVEGETAILEEEAERLARTLETLGPVNPLAVQEHAEEVKRWEFLTEQREDLVEARTSLLKALREIEDTARQLFLESFGQIRKNFHTVFQILFEGGECDFRLEDEADPLESGIEIFAAPRGKRVQRIHLLSSGERALVALSLLFSIYLTKPAPFCLLDEVDAPLDDANVIRFVRLLDEFKTDTQFIVITHNPRTMQVADAVYGVTMQEPGVSTIVGVRLGETEALAS